ncbi:MAG: segregation/condensation protein A [Rhodothermales bacterium]|nr:segregation/condensation protein A [Rhodothermales bacterium]
MYRVRLDQFEGPLDLLMFFIQRDELDIYDIPIAKIADEFLEYVRVLEQIDLDGVGDFLYMAAVLINIKARMLLPSPEVDEEGEPIDPRAELVERLLEYVRFKEAAAGLSGRFEMRSELFTRGEASGESAFRVDAPPVVEDASIFDLITALRRVLTEAVDGPEHEIEAEVYSIDMQRQFIREQLLETSSLSFVNVVARRTKAFIVTTFLAVLEMARLGEITLSMAGEVDDFYIKRVDVGDL